MGRKLGDPADPLLVSVRSGAKFSMPGMMDTVLNLGLNDESRRRAWPSSTSDERFAYDSYRRFISMYGRIVLDIDGRRASTSRSRRPRRGPASPTDAEIPADALARARASEYKAIVEAHTGDAVPAGARRSSCAGAIEAVFRAWNGARAIAYRVRERIRHDLGTAVNVQAMVFGNRDDNSGTGVGFTRNPATGENRPYGDFLVNAQGEDVVAGIRNTEALDAPAATASRRSTTSCWPSSTGSRRTTATCATPSSRSSRASSGCCRPGSASAPARPRCGWPST